VCALAVRLLSGEILAIEDDGGLQWRATATQLALVSGKTGEPVVVLSGDAYDVAEMLATIG
jgi:hypothetical protein